MKYFLTIAALLVLVPAVAQAQEKKYPHVLTGYSELRLDFNGKNNNPFSPQNLTDLAAGIAGYNGGLDVFAEGRWQFYKKLPVSIGGRFQYQLQRSWSSRDEYLLGPNVQVKFGKSFDLTFRLEVLFDLLEGDLGTVHPEMLIYKRWPGKNTWQLTAQLHYFYLHDDRHELAEGHYVTREHQVRSELEVAWHPAGWKLLYPLAYLNGAGFKNYSLTTLPEGIFPSEESRGQFEIGLGAKGEVALGNNVVLWYQARVGYRRLFGDHHQSSPDGVAGMLSAGFYFKYPHNK